MPTVGIRVRAAITATALLAVVIGSGAASADDPPLDPVTALANWIVDLQYPEDAAAEARGAIRVHTEPGHAWPPLVGHYYWRVVPYSSNLGVAGLLRSNHPAKLDVAERWIDWYALHMRDGVAADHWYRVDGTGETTCPQGMTPDYCDRVDAEDSYAATFLGMVGAYADEAGARALTFLAQRRHALDASASVILGLQQSDGLPYARADYKVKYLMDASEVHWGLSALARVSRDVFGDPEASLTYDAAAARVRSGISTRLYDPESGLYHVAIDERPYVLGIAGDPANHVVRADFDTWYPGTVPVAWPHLFGVVAPSDPISQAQMTAINEAWDGRQRPDWTSSTVDEDGFLWPSIGHAALQAGDRARAQAHATFVLGRVLPDFPYPFIVDDAGWLLSTLITLG